MHEISSHPVSDTALCTVILMIRFGVHNNPVRQQNEQNRAYQQMQQSREGLAVLR